jgi:hypothetical protein
MAIVATIIPEVQDIVDSAEERELWIVGKLFEHPPYFHAGKGGDTRLARALRLCVEGRITPNSDGSYTVEGSEHRTYRVGDSCSCPNSQKASSKYCYHFVAVCLYIEWRRRLHPLAPTFSPVALGTLRAGTAPLPPTTPDDEPLGNGYPVDDETLPLPLPPTSIDERLAAAPVAQEDRMADDGYTPEPDNVLTTATAVLERPTPEPAHVTQAVREGHALLVQDDDLEQALTVWTAQRQVVQRFLKNQLIAGTDYYQLRIGKGESKPSLSKAGAEKVLSWLKWSASFTPDTGTWEMLGRPTNLVCYVCQLHTRSGEVVGEGRGARSVTKENGDVNKAIKMAEKSSMVSAVLRTGALSDCFTQDLEDMQDSEPSTHTAPAKKTSQDLRARIWTAVQKQAPDATTREAVEAWIKEKTGLALHPDQYAAILSKIEA